MKAGGEKARLQLRNARFESQRFKILSIVVGCFLICVTFLVSSRPQANGVDSLSRKGSLHGVRVPAMKSSRSSDVSAGREFPVDIVSQQPESQRQRVEERREQAEWVNDNDIEERKGSIAEPAEAASDEIKPETVEFDRKIKENVVTWPDEIQKIASIIAQPTMETAETKQPEEKQGSEAKLQTKLTKRKKGEKHTHTHSGEQQLCDFSDFRINICDMAGDIRMEANASMFVVVDPTGDVKEQTHKVRPYPRKGDETCMSRVTEIIVRTTADAVTAPRCTKTHTAPAVVFSIGGYTGNIFHDFSDVLVPLYNTVQRYRGDVQLLMTNVASWWLIKYDKLLRRLSLHPPLDFAKAGGDVHCFSHAVVSLHAHRELIIERERSLDGLATPDFTRFIRSALSLDRDAPTLLGAHPGAKPRLLIISRRRTRLLLNLDDIVATARDVGFDVVVNESDVANDISQVGQLINSCDAMVGVHGAGLTNMMFLPPGATVIQIVPWGGLQWMARMDYGDPAEAMGHKYVEYNIAVHESSLQDKYPRNHEIFKNPVALHKRGFHFMKTTLMDGQNITIDVNRFRGPLLQALDNLVQ